MKHVIGAARAIGLGRYALLGLKNQRLILACFDQTRAIAMTNPDIESSCRH